MIYGSLQAEKRYRKMADTGIQVLSKSEEPVLINCWINISFKLKLDRNKIKYEETTEKLGTVLNLSPAVFLDPTKYVVENDVLIEKKE